MERSKLKLTVIFLLVVLNLFLLGSVVLQHHQTQAYEATTRQQILLYLENHNVSVAEEVVPWETALSTQAEDLTGQLLPQQALPEEGLPADCEIQPAGGHPADVRCPGPAGPGGGDGHHPVH